MSVPFSFSAPPGADLWRTPSNDAHDAPFRSVSSSPLPLFKSAAISFSTTYSVQFDQAGISFRLTNASSSPSVKWIKAGIEFFQEKPRLSVVCCDNFSDWSVATLPDDADIAGIVGGKTQVTVTIERNDTTLWVYYVNDKGEKLPLREIAWVFGKEGTGEGWELEVGAVVARPTADAPGPLEATIHKLDVEWEKK